MARKTSTSKDFKQDLTEQQAVLQGTIFDLLGKVENGTITVPEMQKLLNNVLTFSTGDTYPPILISHLNNNNSRIKNVARLQTVSYGSLGEESAIYVDQGCVEECLKGNLPIAVLFNSIGHEHRHFVQKAAVNSLEEKDVSPKIVKFAQSMKDSFDKKQLTIDDVKFLDSFLKHIDSDYSRQLKKASEEERMRIYEDIVFSKYTQMKYEEDAREGGLLFTQKTLQELYQSPLCSSFMKKYLESQAPVLQTLANEEKRTREVVYSKSEAFDEALAGLSIEHFREVEDQLKNIDFNPADYRSNSPEKTFTKGLAYAVKLTFETKSVEELQDMFMLNMKCGYPNINAGIAQILHEKQTEEQRAQFAQRITDYLTSQDVSYSAIESIDTDPHSTLLTEKEVATLMVKLLKQDRFEMAMQSMRAIDSIHIEEKAIMPIFDALDDYYKRFTKNLQSGKPIFGHDFDWVSMFADPFLSKTFGRSYIEGYISSVSDNPKVKKKLDELEKKYWRTDKAELDKLYKPELSDEAGEKVYSKKYVEQAKRSDEILHRQFSAFFDQDKQQEKKNVAGLLPEEAE